MPAINVRKKVSKGSGRTPCRTLRLRTQDGGSIRLAVFTDNVPALKERTTAQDVPEEITLSLRELLFGSFGGDNEQPPARWVDWPEEPGFYVRWHRRWGLTEVYHGGPGVPATFEFEKGDGSKYFGPFTLPL